tara:strand:+ start:109 stop:387 length:279 start_codon:yes stop_codon:yes gene_type:complete
MKAFDLGEAGPYQASWQNPPDPEAIEQAEEPVDTSIIISAIQNIDPSIMHPDTQVANERINDAITAVTLIASDRDVSPTEGKALLKFLFHSL